MNNFSLKRLFLLIKKTWVENYRIWLMTLGTLIALYTIFHLLTTDRKHLSAFYPRQLLYSLGLLVSGTLFGNFIWRDFSNKGQSINFLLLPATALEKLLTGIFYSCIVFPAVYITVYSILDSAYIEIVKSITSLKIDESELRVVKIWDTDTIVLPVTVLFLMIQPIALMSNLLFEKFSYIKTITVIIIGIFSLAYFSFFLKESIMKDLLGDKEITGNIFNLAQCYVYSPQQNTVDTVSLPKPMYYFVNLTLTLGCALFFTFITFLKLKEKEI